MKAKSQKKPLRLPVIIDPHVVRSELNLEKNTVFVPSTYREAFLMREKKETLDNGDVKVQKVVVGRTKRGKEVGVLRIATHFRLILSLKKLWEEAGKPKNEILTHSLYTIAKTRNIQPNNRNYEKLEAQLYDLSQIPLEFINTWFSAKDDEFIEKLDPFQILDKLTITKHIKKQKNREIRVAQVEWRFHSNILNSLLGNHTHPIRLDVVTSFKRSKDLAILFYLFADRQLAHKNMEEGIERILANLWQEAVGEVPNYTQRSDWKKKAKPPLDEIVGKPLSSGGVLGVAIKLTENREHYKVVFTKHSVTQSLHNPDEKPILSSQQAKEESPLDLPFSKQQQKSYMELVAIGVSRTKAEKLALSVDSQLITQWIELKPYLSADNPSGFIAQALTEGYGFPDAAVQAKEKTEKERQTQVALKRRRNQERQTQRAQEQQEQQEQDKLMAFFESLSLEKQQQLEQQAKANLATDSFHLRMIKKFESEGDDPFKSLLLKAAFDHEKFSLIKLMMDSIDETQISEHPEDSLID